MQRLWRFMNRFGSGEVFFTNFLALCEVANLTSPISYLVEVY